MQELLNFLSEEECKQIIKMIDANHSQSKVEEGKISELRTSSTAMLNEKDELVKQIHQKIANHLNLDIKHGESLQGQLYEVNQYYQPHHDYISNVATIQKSGNRTKTFMIYLNDDFRGGQTHFVNLNKTIKPKTGKAIYWDNIVHGELQTQYLHQGVAVAEGRKYIITSWWRENQCDFRGDLQKYMESFEIENHKDAVQVVKYLSFSCLKAFAELTERIQKLENKGVKINETKKYFHKEK